MCRDPELSRQICQEDSLARKAALQRFITAAGKDLFESLTIQAKRFGIKNDPEVIYDLFQDTYLGFEKSTRNRFLKGKEPVDDLCAYFVKIGIFLLIKRSKDLPGSNIEPFEPDNYLEFQDQNQDWLSLAINDEQAKIYEQAFNMLGPDCQKILQLKYVEARSHREIADELNTTEENSRNRVKRCKDRLTEIFKKLY